jgi:hypothetical protein
MATYALRVKAADTVDALMGVLARFSGDAAAKAAGAGAAAAAPRDGSDNV